MTLLDQYQEALTEWQDAAQAFNLADGEFIDYQIMRLNAAEQKLAILLRQVRKAYAHDPTVVGAGLPPAPAPDA